MKKNQHVNTFRTQVHDFRNTEEGDANPTTSSTIFKSFFGSGSKNTNEKIGRNNTSTLVFNVEETKSLNHLANIINRKRRK